MSSIEAPRDYVVRDGPLMERQTRLVSLIESVVNVASGFLIAMILWQMVIAPYFGYHITLTDNIQLTAVFTAVSVLRGYLWRRFFNAGLHRALMRYLGGG